MRSSFMRKNCILRSRLTFTRRIVSSPVVLRSWKHPLYICANLPFYLHRCSCPRFFVPLFFLIACFTGTLLSYISSSTLSRFYNFISAFVSPSPFASVISTFLSSCLLFSFLHFFLSLPRFTILSIVCCDLNKETALLFELFGKGTAHRVNHRKWSLEKGSRGAVTWRK